MIKKTTTLILASAMAIVSCQSKPKCGYAKIEGFAQGTSYHITYQDCANKDYSLAIDSVLKAFDRSLSEYQPNSVISRINANDTSVKVDEMFRTVFEKSRYIWEQTDGAMDITVGPIIDVLGFGPMARKKVDSAKIMQLLKFVGMQKVHIVGDRLVKEDTAIKLDVNSIGQGYSVDVVYNFLQNKGIENFMVEIGGEVRAKGKNPKDSLWRIGIDKPTDGNMVPGENLQTVIKLNNMAVTTSGNYRKYFEENGIKYSHIINPKTGFPVKSKLLSVTIFASDCITADGWDTGFMVLGLEKSIETLKKHPELGAYLIYSDDKGQFRVYMTDGVKKMLAE